MIGFTEHSRFQRFIRVFLQIEKDRNFLQDPILLVEIRLIILFYASIIGNDLLLVSTPLETRVACITLYSM